MSEENHNHWHLGTCYFMLLFFTEQRWVENVCHHSKANIHNNGLTKDITVITLSLKAIAPVFHGRLLYWYTGKNNPKQTKGHFSRNSVILERFLRHPLCFCTLKWGPELRKIITMGLACMALGEGSESTSRPRRR